MYKTKYKNHDSMEKQICREKIIKKVESIKKDKIRILTLPSTNFYLEEVLLGIPGVTVDCIEREKKIFIDQLEIIKDRKLNINLVNNDIFEYLKETKHQYDLIWVDLCGPLNSRIVSNFLSLIQARETFSSNAFLVLTILGAREQEKEELLEFYKCKSLEEFRQSKLPELAEELANEVDKTCELLDLYKYPSGSKNAPMIMFTFNLKTKTNGKEQSKENSPQESRS